MILGHNGIRNKIAKDWDIGNMNILHWSRDLEKLSKYFLLSCEETKDVCNFLVSKDITIGQNIFFSEASPGPRWVGRTIRHWYSELGYDIKSWEQFSDAQKRNGSQFTHFTQMIWPNTEFVGCAAAKMSGGYMTTCYYHPAVSENIHDFSFDNKGCTKCSQERHTCSRDFNNLCGLDVQYSPGNSFDKSKWILLVNFLNIFIWII
ncbi:cysteine-rich venom protein pseudecin-like isoform X2 [Eupeodes corollae]|nr:cysteine-rich venom protein pseudecin-like isoform X2 [Eupeodes corollae]